MIAPEKSAKPPKAVRAAVIERSGASKREIEFEQVRPGRITHEHEPNPMRAI